MARQKKKRLYKFDDQEVELESSYTAMCTVTKKEVKYNTATLIGLIKRSYSNSWDDFKSNYKCKEGKKLLSEQEKVDNKAIEPEDVCENEPIEEVKEEGSIEPYRLYLLQYYKSSDKGLTKEHPSKMDELKETYHARFPFRNFSLDLLEI